MSELPIQPGVSQPTPEESFAIGEEFAKAGIPTATINEHLKSIGRPPYQPHAGDEAQRTLDRLKSNPEWVKRFNDNDLAAMAEFGDLTAKITLTPRTDKSPDPAPEDFNFNLRRMPEGEFQQRMQSESAHFAADLKLPQNVAAALIENVLDHAERVETMNPDEKVNHGEKELVDLRTVLAKSGDPDAQMKEAQKTLKQHSGRDIDIASVAQKSGAPAAMELVIHAQALAYAAARK